MTNDTNMLQKTAGNKRLDWVDYARGMAILLVMYRHTIVGLTRSGIKVSHFVFQLQEVVFNFRMPVFFVLSGVFLAGSLKKRSLTSIFNKKASTLLYPYVIWSVVLITFQIIFSAYTNSSRTIKDFSYILLQPRELDHMWYLLALFNTSALFLLLWKVLYKYPVVNIVLSIILHFLSFYLKDYSFFSDPFYHYIFLVLGVYASRYLISLNEKPVSFFLIWLLIISPFFIAGQYFWLYHQDQTDKFWVLFLLIIIIACAYFCIVCNIIYHLTFFKWLRVIGKNSLYIYILHIYFISLFRVVSIRVLHIDNVIFLITGSLILGALIPLAIYRTSVRLNMKYLFSLDKLAKPN